MTPAPLATLARAIAHPRMTLVAIGVVGIAMGAMLGMTALGVAYAAQQREATALALSREGQPTEVLTDLAKPGATPAPAPRPVTVTEQRLGEGRTLVAALRALGVSQDVASRVVIALGRQLDPRLLRPTDLVRVERDGDDDAVLKRVIYRRSESRAWVVAPNDSGDMLVSVAPAGIDAAFPNSDSANAGTTANTAAAQTGAGDTTLAAMGPGFDLGPIFPPSGVQGSSGSFGSASTWSSSSSSSSSSVPAAAQGFNHGQAMSLSVVVVDGKPVEISTARAFERMREAARRDGVHILIVSGFRTMEQQRNLYALYRAGHGNLAAVPGFSNHQSGHALDLNASARGVYPWLQAHAADFGFRRTVPSETWHWEHW